MLTNEIIKALRKERGYTQQQLADKAGISRVAVGNYERGDRVPTIEVANKIAEALGVGIDNLFEKSTIESANEYIKQQGGGVIDEENYERNLQFELEGELHGGQDRVFRKAEKLSKLIADRLTAPFTRKAIINQIFDFMPYINRRGLAEIYSFVSNMAAGGKYRNIAEKEHDPEVLASIDKAIETLDELMNKAGDPDAT